MSGVVLRCPNCGTTKAEPGECDACHEAQVRYYCTNHTPGRWLETTACTQCGARFGDRARPPAAPVPPVRSRSPAAPPAPTSTPAPPRPRSTPGRPERGRSPWARRTRRPVEAEERLDGPEVVTDRAVAARLRELVEAASRVRRPPWGSPPVSEYPRMGLSLGGCLARALVLAIFLFIAFAAMLVMIGGSLFEMFGAYYY